MPKISHPDPSVMDLLLFRLAGDRYAIPLAHALHIFPAVAVTRLPGAPAVVEGIVSVHGQLTPVYDLRRRFGLLHREMIPEDHLLLVDAAGRRALLHVDAAEEVTAVPAEAIDDPPEVVVGSRAVAGVARLPGGLVLIHDLARFLNEAESRELDEALAAAADRSGDA